jgi:uncharacterized membrane protein YecN with MAPEG domain
MQVTLWTFVALAPLFLFLSIAVIRQRRRSSVAYGDGNDLQLRKRVGAHSNFSQYVPFILLGMGMGEMLEAPFWLLLLSAILLVVGRHLHAYGMIQAQENFKFRVSGMLLTFSSLFGVWISLVIVALR